MRFYKFCLWKAYFDKGFGFFNYAKYPLFLIGLGDIMQSGGDWKKVAVIAIVLGVFCLIIGRLAFKYKYVEAEHEVQNVVNPFVQEMRQSKVLNTCSPKRIHGK